VLNWILNAEDYGSDEFAVWVVDPGAGVQLLRVPESDATLRNDPIPEAAALPHLSVEDHGPNPHSARHSAHSRNSTHT
jgi:hypothetical protein